MSDKFSISRRRLLQAGAAGRRDAAAGRDAGRVGRRLDRPEQTTVRVGFIPLTDCAPLAIAAAKGFDKNMVLPRAE